MINEFRDLILDLPSVGQFLSRVSNSLRDRKSVLVLVPPMIDADRLAEKLDGRLWMENFTREEIALEEFPDGSEPLQVLNALLGPTIGGLSQWSPLPLLIKADHLPDVFLVRDFPHASANSRDAWIRTLADWANWSHLAVNERKRPPSLCIIANANLISEQVATDLFLDVFWWWGFPSALEISLMCRLQNPISRWDPLERWREKLIPSVAPGDPALIDAIWNSNATNIEDMLRLISEYVRAFPGEEVSASDLQEVLERSDQLILDQPGDPPPPHLRNLWEKGAIYATLEYGIEVHPALLMSYASERVRRRIWRSQAELLLPIIDGLRVVICHDLTEGIGKEWPYRWERPERPEEAKAVKEDPLSTQWGYLVHLLRDNSHFSKYRHWCPIASQAHRIRNHLAHYRTIRIDQMMGFLASLAAQGVG